jgi:hypothetical protein
MTFVSPKVTSAPGDANLINMYVAFIHHVLFCYTVLGRGGALEVRIFMWLSAIIKILIPISKINTDCFTRELF